MTKVLALAKNVNLVGQVTKEKDWLKVLAVANVALVDLVIR